jgi:hypothetical protein
MPTRNTQNTDFGNTTAKKYVTLKINTFHNYLTINKIH